MADVFESTYLHDIRILGGMQDVGAGSPGGTLWQMTILVDGQWVNSYLHDIRTLGGMTEVGAGSPGGTLWE